MFDFLSGSRTKIGAFALLASGVAMILRAISSGDMSQIAEGVAAIGAGLAAIGIRFAKVGT